MILQSLVNGIVMGATVTIATVGLTLIWGVERFPNVGQGDLVTLAAYLMFTFNTTLDWPFWVSAGLVVVATGGIYYVVHAVVFRPLRGASMVTLFVASIGLAFALRGLNGFIWGNSLRGFRIPLLRNIMFAGLEINPVDLGVIGAALVFVLVVYAVMYWTRMGVEMRAVADVPDLARVSGIRSQRVLSSTWVLAGLVSGGAGVALGASIGVSPLLGWNMLLAMFAAAILGGIGSFSGTIVGAMVIGVTMTLSSVWISATYEVAVAFGVLALVLLVRPAGLFSR